MAGSDDRAPQADDLPWRLALRVHHPSADLSGGRKALPSRCGGWMRTCGRRGSAPARRQGRGSRERGGPSNVPMDAAWTNLPERNVRNTRMGYDMYHRDEWRNVTPK